MEIVRRFMQCLNFLSGASIVLALAVFFVGWRAAIIWGKASEIKTDRSKSGLQLSNPGTFQPIESPGPELSLMDRAAEVTITIEAIIIAASESAALNRKAAGLTACAVGFSMLSSVLGALAGCLR